MAGNVPKGRGLLVSVAQNFMKSLRSTRAAANTNANLVGTDPYGNKYFEVPADPR